MIVTSISSEQNFLDMTHKDDDLFPNRKKEIFVQFRDNRFL